MTASLQHCPSCPLYTTIASRRRRPATQPLVFGIIPALNCHRSDFACRFSPRRPMVERKLRPAPSSVHLLPARKTAKPGPSSAPKLFVLDTNVLMHDPTSVFHFEEHDVYLPMLTLEELDANKKGMTDVARNARQASRFLDELVATQAANGTIIQGICP